MENARLAPGVFFGVRRACAVAGCAAADAYHARMLSAAAAVDTQSLAARLAGPGFAFVAGAAMRELLAASGALSDWDAFADSWDGLEPDEYMADHGR